MKVILSTLILFLLVLFTFGQTEVLTNKDIILMSSSGLSKSLIIRKIKETEGNYDTTAKALIELKKAGVADDVIELMMNNSQKDEKNYSDSTDDKAVTPRGISISFPNQNQTFTDKSRIVLKPKEALKNARTIAIKKSSLHPSRQSLEKELLKRKEWKDLNLNIVRYKTNADLLIEIGYVSMSWITHRYTYRIFDNKSGTVIAAGETTSWGSLSENLARGIAKRLKKAMKSK